MPRLALGEGDRNRALPRARARAAAQRDRAARGAVEATDQHQRLDIVEIGQASARGQQLAHAERRVDRKLEIGEHRRIDAPHETVDDGVGVLGERDDLRDAAAGARHIVKQEAIDRSADPEAEHTRCARVVVHGLDHRLVVPDVAVGEEEDEARARVGVLEARGARDEHALAVLRGPRALEQHREALRVLGQDHGDLGEHAPPCSIGCGAGVDPPARAVDRHRAGGHGDREAAAIGGQREKLRRLDAAAPRLYERRVDRGHHLGAAAAGRTRDELVGRRDVLRGRGLRLGPQHRGVACEGDDVEGVVRAHARDRLARKLLRLLDREAVHRSRHIEHEHELARSDLGGCDARGRLEHEREETALRVGVARVRGVREERRLDGAAAGVPTQHEVAVRNRLLVDERDHALRGRIAVDAHLVLHALDRAERRAARVDRDLHRDVVARARLGTRRHRRDLVGVGNLVGRIRESRSARRALRGGGHEEEASVDLADRRGRREDAALGAAVGVLREERNAVGVREHRVDRGVVGGAHGNRLAQHALEARAGDRGAGFGLDARGAAQHEAFAHGPAVGKLRQRRARERALARDVARPDDHRERVLRDAVLALDQFDGGDAHPDRGARLDVRDRLREDVRTLLLEQARDDAGLARLLVDRLRDRAFLDLALDDLLARRALHDHRHAVDRRAVREREGVDGLDRARERIGVGLLDDGARERPGDLDRHIGAAKRTHAERIAIAVDGLERAAFGDLHDSGVCDRRALAGADEDRHDERGRDDEQRRRGDAGEPDARDHLDEPGARAATRGFLRCGALEDRVARGARSGRVLVVPRAQQRIEPIPARDPRRLVVLAIVVARIRHDCMSSRVNRAAIRFRASATRR